MAFPGAAGHGCPSERPLTLVNGDLAGGYITADAAVRDCDLLEVDIAQVAAQIAKCEPT